jgi:hypothetical protein
VWATHGKVGGGGFGRRQVGLSRVQLEDDARTGMTGGPHLSATAAREREEAGWRQRVGPESLSWATAENGPAAALACWAQRVLG